MLNTLRPQLWRMSDLFPKDLQDKKSKEKSKQIINGIYCKLLTKKENKKTQKGRNKL